jgi:alpha-tubulin suppressor-like RCC1 family protein
MAGAGSQNVLAKTLLLSVLMIFLGISAAMGSLNEAENTELPGQNDVRNVILPISQLNEPGFQEGSIFTDTTLSSGFHHTCAILDTGDVSCWGEGIDGRLGNGGTSDKTTPTLTASLGTGRTAVTVSTGGYHTCAILDNGDVSCWGEGSDGQLGNGGTSDQTTPTLTSSLGTGRTAVALSSGYRHTCAILDDGNVSCWGDGLYGRLGNGGTSDKTTPTVTSSLGTGRTAVALASGLYHTCAILDNGDVSCWGLGAYGQLGNGGTSDKTTPTLTSSLGTGRKAVALSSGGAHTCALLDNGDVSCWGDGTNGKLGNGGTSDKTTPTITSSLGTGRTAVGLSSGEHHTCAILDNGSVSCWGRGSDGQLGDGGTSDQTTPKLTSSLGAGRMAVGLSSGYFHTCLILDNGSSSCWGDGSYGQLGNGATSDQTTPTLTSSLGSGRIASLSERDFDGDGNFTVFQAHTTFVDRTQSLSSGDGYTCALLDNGSVSCWGGGLDGRLGNGGTSDKTTPTLTSGFGNNQTAVALSSSINAHMCALLDNGSVACWGWGTSGQMGNGGTSTSTTPTPTSSLGTGRTAVGISAGAYHTCALLDNGAVSCWGEGSSGQLGHGGTSDKTTPTLTSSLGTGRTAVSLSSGMYHTCALLDNGSVSCWGEGSSGKLGSGGTSQQNSPTLTSSFGVGRTATAISAGGYHTCALLDNGAVSCWGLNNYGQLGNGGTSSKTTPTLTSSLGAGRTAVAISSGNYHTCAILDNGALSCWGIGNKGQLGNGGTSNKYTPTLTSSLGSGRTADAISTGNSHTCAILDNGTVSCWGEGSKGKLGNGGTSDKYTPTLTSSLGAGRSAGLVSGDLDGDGVVDDLDDYPGNPIRTVNCNAGQYGRYRCIDAPLGKYVPSSGSMYATDADAGYFVSSLGQSNQTACSAGTFQANISQSSCDDADAGHYVATTAQTSQTACAVGTYQASTGQSSCDDATAGYYVDQTGQSSQTACSAGTYNPNTGSSSSSACGDADAGYYVPSSGQAVQTACAPGTYQASTGKSSCDNADPGHYVATTAQTSQTACAVGTYQASTGQSSCDDATAGYYVNQTGQSSQTACSAGTYNPNTGSSSSSACGDSDAGYYVPSSGQASQTACAAGTYQASTGQSSCDNADPGHYVATTAQTSQTACPVGTYQASTGQSSCDDATAGYYVNQTGQSSQTACPVGTYQASTGQSSCDDATAGYYVDQTGQSSQTACSAGTYNPNTGSSSSSACGDADAGYYVPSSGQAVQTACAPGTYQASTGKSSCDNADPGHYVATTAQTSQTACAVGTYQASTGQSSCDDATAGYYVNQTGQSSQTACPIGKFSSTTASVSCTNAPAGYYVSSTGQSSPTACSAGSYQADSGQTSCDAADAGYYVSGTAQTSQTACPVGTYQANTGQSSCDFADTGYYVATTAQISQTPCAGGTYQAITGQTSCIEADAGYYVDQTGQVSQTACAVGTYQANTGQSSCDDADAGYYVDQMGQSSQTACSAGTYQANTGQSSCIDANAGYYVPTTAQTSQTPCAGGTYQAITGQPSCIEADAGYYVDQTGQVSQTACAVGTYQANTGQSSCDDADAGYYVATTAQTSQTPCAGGTYQANTGQSSCELASPGHFVSTSGQIEQTVCAPGTYQSNTARVSCEPANAGYYVPIPAQTSQVACALGTYQPEIGQTACVRADANHYVDQTGQANQTACPAGTTNQYIGSTTPTACAFSDGDSTNSGVSTLTGIAIVFLLIIPIVFVATKRRTTPFGSDVSLQHGQQGPLIEGVIDSSVELSTSSPVVIDPPVGPPLMETEQPIQAVAVSTNVPTADTAAQRSDENGYEWFTLDDGTNFYRTEGSGAEWVKFEN